jgi:hypothetical protein
VNGPSPERAAAGPIPDLAAFGSERGGSTQSSRSPHAWLLAQRSAKGMQTLRASAQRSDIARRDIVLQLTEGSAGMLRRRKPYG